MDAEDAPTIEPKVYDEVVKTIADASFTGDDGLDYVETLVVLNAIKGDKTGDRRMSEIKPCPHCGWTIKLICDDDQYKIYCTNPDCDASYGWCADREYLIKGWNRRVKNE